MIRIAILAGVMLCTAGSAEARRSLMDDVMSRPSAYTQNRQRLEAAKTEYRIQMMQLRVERQRLLNERLRLQQERTKPRLQRSRYGHVRSFHLQR